MGTLSLSPDTFDGHPALLLDAGSSLDMNSVETLASLFNEAADGGLPLVVDVSSVERMSTSAVQIFLAADRALAEPGCRLALRKPTSTFLAAFADSGVSLERMNWTVEAAGD